MIRKKIFNWIGLLASILPISLFQISGMSLISPPPVDPVSMEAFFDGVMLSNLTKSHIPGVTIAVVKDGETLFSKGYGYADIENNTPVDPNTTLFRIGSTNKLITWTAVMQLAEQNKLDLDTDVNSYLDFEIPDTYTEPITLRDLLSHTAGFEDRSFSVIAENVDSFVSTGEWLKNHMPARINPPGKVTMYSNYGTALAGYIVELVSGMKYEDYINQYIFQPLQMTNSTAQQPLPQSFQRNMATGYRFINSSYIPQEFELYHIAPAGSISASATDMANFMIAHLQEGQFNNTQILQPETARQMHSQLFTNNEHIDGMAYGFFTSNHDGQPIIYHGGDTIYFHSQLALLPEANMGIFISCNSLECMGFPQTTYKAFLEYYFPVDYSTLKPISNAAEHANIVQGQYQSNRKSSSTAESLNSLISTIEITALEDGSLSMLGKQLIEIEPFVYQVKDGDTKFYYQPGENGQPDQFFISGQPFLYERITWPDTPLFNFVILGLNLILGISLVINLPLSIRKHCKQDKKAKHSLAQIATGIFTLTGLISALLIILVGTTLMDESPLYESFQGTIIWTTLYIGIVIFSLTSLGMTVVIWKNRYWGVWQRCYYTLITISAGTIIWFVNYWHLLNI